MNNGRKGNPAAMHTKTNRRITQRNDGDWAQKRNGKLRRDELLLQKFCADERHSYKAYMVNEDVGANHGQ
jgi:hypothetical protein